jgi:hypothetical protein
MAREKKQSKGPKDRNSNYQMKNGNSVSKKKEKKPDVTKSSEARASAQAAEKKSLISGLSSSISCATSSISKMLKH